MQRQSRAMHGGQTPNTSDRGADFSPQQGRMTQCAETDRSLKLVSTHSCGLKSALRQSGGNVDARMAANRCCASCEPVERP
jgi:hypothetical protein